MHKVPREKWANKKKTQGCDSLLKSTMTMNIQYNTAANFTPFTTCKRGGKKCFINELKLPYKR